MKLDRIFTLISTVVVLIVTMMHIMNNFNFSKLIELKSLFTFWVVRSFFEQKPVPEARFLTLKIMSD